VGSETALNLSLAWSAFNRPLLAETSHSDVKLLSDCY
jgi:hypothetical protein